MSQDLRKRPGDRPPEEWVRAYDATQPRPLRRVGAEWIGPCPVCGGHDRFHITAGDKAGTLAGCRKCGPERFKDIAEALHLIKVDGNGNGNGGNGRHVTYPPPVRQSKNAPTRRHPEQRAPLKPCPEPPKNLKHPKLGKPAQVWRISEPSGKLWAVHARFNKRGGAKAVLWWRGGWTLDGAKLVDAPLYLAENIATYDTSKPLYVAEGERAADALAEIGAQVVGTVTGADERGRTHGRATWQALEMFEDVVFWPDHDSQGLAHMRASRQRLRHGRILDPAALSVPEKGDAVEWIADRNAEGLEPAEILRRLPELQMLAEPEPEPVAEPGYPTTDLANAERYAAQHGRHFRYSDEIGAWLCWDGRRWQVDKLQRAKLTATKTARRIYREAADAAADGDHDGAVVLAKHAKSSLSNGKLDSMLSVAQVLPEIAVTMDQFDSDPYHLNTPAGLLDLRTGEILQSSGNDHPMVTKITGAEPQEDAECPRWRQFLAEIFVDRQGHADQGLIDYVQRAIGYSLTGSTQEQKLFLLHGDGANGKSVFLETLRQAIGDYAQPLRFEALLWNLKGNGANGPSPDVANLRGARFALASEPDGGARFSEGLIKSLTGSDVLTARQMYRDPISWEPTHKLWLAANHPPRTFDASRGFWRRIALIPFRASFVPPEELDPFEPLQKLRDNQLPDDLAEELPGILRWALEGARRWIEDGLGTCEAVTDATAEYRQGQDPLAEFLAACCVVERGVSVSASALREAWDSWAEDAGYSMPWHCAARMLTERGFELSHTGSIRVRRGLRLLDAFAPDPYFPPNTPEPPTPPPPPKPEPSRASSPSSAPRRDAPARAAPVEKGRDRSHSPKPRGEPPERA